MKVSGLKLAVYVSLLVHATALSVIYAVQRASLGARSPEAWDATNVFEITEESPPLDQALPAVVALPQKETQPLPIARSSALPVKEVVQKVCVTESLSSLWTEQPPSLPKAPEVSLPPATSGAAALTRNAGTAEAGAKRNSTGAESGVYYLSNPKPVYPPESRKRKEQGTVVLEVEVDVQGAARQIAIKQSAGYKYLDEAAVQAVKQWRFEPAQRNNAKIASRVEIPVRFELLNSL